MVSRDVITSYVEGAISVDNNIPYLTCDLNEYSSPPPFSWWVIYQDLLMFIDNLLLG